MQTNLTMEDLTQIRDAVPHLDLIAIRALRRAGFDLVHREPDPQPASNRNLWHAIPRPMRTSVLQAKAPVTD